MKKMLQIKSLLFIVMISFSFNQSTWIAGTVGIYENPDCSGELQEFPSEFSAAPGHSINELKRMGGKKRQKIIAKHNLIVSFTEIRRVKQAIHDGLLWELVENRLRASPALMKVFSILERILSIQDYYKMISSV